MSDKETTCFHCGLPVPPGTKFSVQIDGEPRPMCCAGCEAVAKAIVDSGLTSFYKHRTDKPDKPQELVPDFLKKARIYDDPEIQQTFVKSGEGDLREASLILEGIVCAACVWLNERHLASLPGIQSVSINYTTHRARVVWDDSVIHLSDILDSITQIGYMAHPYDPNRQQAIMEAERKTQMRRLGVAGLFGMQVMMMAVALYGGDFWGIDESFRDLFRWSSLGMTIPVLLYSAKPFFTSAWRDIRRLTLGMDVPISLGISFAFAGSVWATLNGTGHVYYDSVVMFVFFLLTGRYFEMMARKKAGEETERIARLAPATATRLLEDGSEEVVAVAHVRHGDRLLVKPGETVPADGNVIEGRSSVDESILTGESMPVFKEPGLQVTGGSINTESPLVMRAEKVGEETVLSQILNLIERAQTEKPGLARIADRSAAWFVLGVLVLAVVTGVYWWLNEPAQWLPITISVLVVTCPCAFSLATPTAITAATGRLTNLGLLVTRGNALETVARATHFVFDKTGTLTEGKPKLRQIDILTEGEESEALTIAAALERRSEHPLAKALMRAADGIVLPPVSEVSATAGGGITGKVNDQRYAIGRHQFIADALGLQLPLVVEPSGSETTVYLANQDGLIAAFRFVDQLRDGARELVSTLRNMNKQVWLLTGDQESTARLVAQEIGVDHVEWALRPEDKLARVRELQKGGAIIAMTGDGVNDAPVLAGADVSIAMGGGTQLAVASSDMVLLGEDLDKLSDGVNTAWRTLKIIRQNLLWAVGYNLLALPLAALGYIQPWLAAIGMSASSLIVVLNALRLTR